MYCEKCGNRLEDGVRFCSKCGAPVKITEQPETQEDDEKRYKDKANDVHNNELNDEPNDEPNNEPNNEPNDEPNNEPNNEPNDCQEYGQKYGPKGEPKHEPEAKNPINLILTICLVIFCFITVGSVGFIIYARSASKGSDRALVYNGKQLSGADSGSLSNSSGATDAGMSADSQGRWNKVIERSGNLSQAEVNFVSSDVSQYPLVKLYLSVEDSDGNPIKGISGDTAAVREKVSGGKYIERSIKGFEQLQGNEGISIDLVGDKSDSMSGVMPQVQNVMDQFVDSLDYESGDKAEIISFDTYVMYMCTYTGDKDLLKNGIANITTEGGTALYNALIEGITSSSEQKGARCVIAFTDGNDNNSDYGVQDVITLAQENSVPVYIIGAGDIVVDPLQQITSSTGGRYWNIDELSDMSDILNTIYVSQKDMYCVSYVSDDSIAQYDSRDIGFSFADDNGTKYSGQTETTVTPVKTASSEKHDSRYEIVTKDISWEDANRECSAKGGHLVTITSQDELDQVSALADKAGIDYLWIGGYTSIRDDAAFGHWVTGENFDFADWYEGEPSRNDMDGTPEMYLMMWKMHDVWSWNDQRNDPVNESGLDYFKGDTGYICEYEN